MPESALARNEGSIPFTRSSDNQGLLTKCSKSSEQKLLGASWPALEALKVVRNVERPKAHLTSARSFSASAFRICSHDGARQR